MHSLPLRDGWLTPRGLVKRIGRVFTSKATQRLILILPSFSRSVQRQVADEGAQAAVKRMRASFVLPFARAIPAPAETGSSAGGNGGNLAADALATQDDPPARTTGADIRAFIDEQGAAAANSRPGGRTAEDGTDRAAQPGQGG